MNANTIRNAMLGIALTCAIAACRGDSDVAAGATGPAAASGGAASLAADTGTPGQADSGFPMPDIGRDPAQGFARLPDRGELVAYPAGKPVRREGAYTWHRADLSEAHALRAIVDGTLTLTTPSGERLRFAYDRHVEHSSGDWTWIGHLAGGSVAEDAILTFGPNAVVGTIAEPGGSKLALAMRDGQSWLVETDRALLSMQSRAAGRYEKPDYLVPPPPRPRPGTGRTARSEAAAPRPEAAAATTVVDVLIGYTTGFDAANRTGPGGNISIAETQLHSIVAIANESYVNSGLDIEVRLVHTMMVDYTDATDNSDALMALTGTDGSNPVPVPAALQPLHAARDQYGADLVTLVRKFTYPENSSCGVAWLIGVAQQVTSPDDEWLGMSVVSDGSSGGFFCEATTYAHELGHNMGLQHDIDTAKGEDGVLGGDEYGRFPYSFGYRTSPGQGDFYTVMAYSDTQEHGYHVFSNPDISVCGGFPCGVEGQADNARTLAQTTGIVAAFRATVVPGEDPIFDIDRDVNGDGRADLLWYNLGTGRFQAWHMDGPDWAYGPMHGITAGKYRVAGVGDFNGDGVSDMLWHDLAETELWIWQMSPDGTKQIAFLRRYPSGWSVGGVGDVNGDGRDDVFWYNPALGRTQAWYMDGSSWSYGPVNGLAPNRYEIAAMGDVDGNGLADVVWHDNARTETWVWLGSEQLQGGFTVDFLRSYPAGWEIAGTGDADGDGRADIFWHNAAAGRVQAWLMDGSTFAYGPTYRIASKYQLDAIDDFDGDGLVDIFWHDSVHAWLWLADAQGSYTVEYLRPYPAGGWAVTNSP